MKSECVNDWSISLGNTTYEIVFTLQQFQEAIEHLTHAQGLEQVAFCLAKTRKRSNEVGFLIQSVLPVPSDAILVQKDYLVLIDPRFIIYVIKSCKRLNSSLILMHSHLRKATMHSYSQGDDEAERRIFTKVRERIPEQEHASVLLDGPYLLSRVWSKNEAEPIPVDTIAVVTKSTNGRRSVVKLPKITNKFEYDSINKLFKQMQE